MRVIVGSKGRVTLPKAIRDHLGVGPGIELEVTLNGNNAIVLLRLQKERPQPDFAAFVGHAGPGPTTNEIMAMLRDD